jgi:Leucine-rich repeat (LRR) protein
MNSTVDGLQREVESPSVVTVSLPSLSNFLGVLLIDVLCSLLQLTMDQQQQRVRDDAVVGRIIVLGDDNGSSSSSNSSSDEEDQDHGQRAAAPYDDSTVVNDDFSGSTHFDGGEEYFVETFQKLKENDPHTIKFRWAGEDINYYNQNITNENWEEIGTDISNNTHLKDLCLHKGALNDRKMTFLFRGLTRSSTLKRMSLYNNALSVVGVRSMVPFLKNATNLLTLNLHNNNLQSEGFNVLLRALRDSPVETLNCDNCGIETIGIDSEHTPKKLKYLRLYDNSINADGCRGLAELLQGGGCCTNCAKSPAQ